jgi:hypothetical protein
MRDLEQLANLRFGMSTVPSIGGQPGTYEERWSQWFLERSFFRDFVYRNPRGKKKGTQLSDAVVLYDDVILIVDVKAQCGNHDPVSWATEKLLDARGQVKATHDDLTGGHIKKLRNDLYGDVSFDPGAYPNRIGVVVLAQSSVPYDAAKHVPEFKTTGFPIHVFSLDDFAMVASRCDTAYDLITFLELRAEIGAKENYLVHNEAGNITKMLPHVESVLRKGMKPTTEEILQKSVAAQKATITGEVLASPDWRYSLAIDDMIARAHDVDPNLPYNSTDTRRVSLAVAAFLSGLTRGRRIKLGKRLIEACDRARDGRDEYFHHVQPSRGTAWVCLVTSKSRAERVEFVMFLAAYAQMKYGVRQCLGVATEPIGGGRSHDFCISQGPQSKQHIEFLKTCNDPFPGDVPL